MRRMLVISLVIAGFMWAGGVEDLVNEAVTLRAAGNYDAAVAKLAQALKSKAKHPLANFEMGKTYLEIGNSENAILYLKNAQNFGYDALKTHVALGTAYEANGNNIEAAIEYGEAAKLAPNDPECHCNLARVSQQSAVAEAEYLNALKIEPNYAPAMVGLANLYANNNDSVRAMAYFDKAQKAKPDYAPTYFALGSYHLQKKRYQKSIESFTRYIQLEPRKPRGYAARADAYSKHKKDSLTTKEAIKDVRQAVALGDTSVGTLKFLAFLYNRNNQPRDSKDVLKLIVAKDAMDTQAWLDLAKVYGKIDSARGAADAYVSLLKVDPTYEREIAPDLAMVYYNLTKYDSAVIWFKKRLQYDTLTVATYVNLALSYLQLKDYNNAVENFKKALKLNPKYLRGHLWLGQTYEFLGNKAGAKTEYNTVLKLDPKSKEARDAREGLKRLARPATPTQPNYQDYWDKYWDDLYKK